MFGRVLLAAALLPSVIASRHAHPVVAWSSSNPTALSGSPSSSLHDLLVNDKLCDHDAIVLVEQKGLYASDLRALPPSAGLVRRINLAKSSVELPYMPSGEYAFSDMAYAIAQRCQSRMVTAPLAEVPSQLETLGKTGRKHVMCVEMPHMEGHSSDRKHLMAEHESMLSAALDKVAAAFPNHFIAYSGFPADLDRRQYYVENDDFDFDLTDIVNTPDVATPTTFRKTAASEGGILKRYQLLTPGLIICLLVVLFVLLPMLYLSISALASISSSVRLDAPKGFDAAEKKNQ